MYLDCIVVVDGDVYVFFYVNEGVFDVVVVIDVCCVVGEEFGFFVGVLFVIKDVLVMID